jgi:serine/threonine-protein phosphatase 2A regulatory subunit A
LSKAVGEDITRDDLVSAFVRLLKDNEAEVRTAAAGQVPGMLNTMCTLDIILLPPAFTAF